LKSLASTLAVVGKFRSVWLNVTTPESPPFAAISAQQAGHPVDVGSTDLGIPPESENHAVGITRLLHLGDVVELPRANEGRPLRAAGHLLH
jgi:hypothetical protein